MLLKWYIFWLAGLGLLFASAGNAKADNLVVNGGFETGDYTGWTLSGDTEFVTTTFWPVHSGNYAAQFAGYGDDAIVSQDITTTVGATYLVSYWLDGDGDTPNDFSVSFGDQTLFSQVDMALFPTPSTPSPCRPMRRFRRCNLPPAMITVTSTSTMCPSRRPKPAMPTATARWTSTT